MGSGRYWGPGEAGGEVKTSRTCREATERERERLGGLTVAISRVMAGSVLGRPRSHKPLYCTPNCLVTQTPTSGVREIRGQNFSCSEQGTVMENFLMAIVSSGRKDLVKFAEYSKLWILNTSHVSRMSWVKVLVGFNFSFTNHSAIEVPESGVTLATYDTREEVQGETELDN